jgi:hypothetical protein
MSVNMTNIRFNHLLCDAKSWVRRSTGRMILAPAGARVGGDG